MSFKEYYQVIFETIGEGLIITSEEGKIVMINPRITELFGFDESELLGEKIEILIPKRYKTHHENHRKGFHAKPTKRSMGKGVDLVAQKKDGSIFPVEISLNHFKADDQQYAIALITDVSQRKVFDQEIKTMNSRLEERVKERTDQLEKSQLLHKMIARNFPDGTINVFDKKLNYVFVEGKELFSMGITSEKLIGTNYLDRLPVRLRSSIENNLMRVFEGEKQTLEIKLGENFYVLNAVPLSNEGQEVEQILVVEENITEVKKAEEEIKKALNKEIELNELKSRFVSMASHEFRTPLSTILSSASLVEKYIEREIPDKTEKHINRIKGSVDNLTTLLNDFLSLDKLNEGKVSIRPELFNLKEFCTEVGTDLLEIAKPGQRISWAHEGEKEVKLDRNVLKNIAFNLITNAIKYSPESTEIKCKTSLFDEILCFEVSDQGMGIPLEEQKHLFSRFFRAQNVTNLPGTGLGLNIVKKYIDLFKGRIQFESKEGEGTTFTVFLPQYINQVTDEEDCTYRG